MKDLYAFHAVVGYFRSSGYFALQPFLKDLKEIRILVGINVDQIFAETQRKGLLFFGDEARTKKEFLNWFIEDIREGKYSKEVEDGIRWCGSRTRGRTNNRRSRTQGADYADGRIRPAARSSLGMACRPKHIAAFVICGLVPLMPFIVGSNVAFPISDALTGLIFFSIGSVKARWSTPRKPRSLIQIALHLRQSIHLGA